MVRRNYIFPRPSESEYNLMHKWNLYHWRKSGMCSHCKYSAKTQWANVSGQYRAKDKEDWIELCKRCHVVFDRPSNADGRFQSEVTDLLNSF